MQNLFETSSLHTSESHIISLYIEKKNFNLFTAQINARETLRYTQNQSERRYKYQ